jgi:beta-glucosidase
MRQKLKFPKDFLWGAATSAHQIEGNNTNSDWWFWEHSIKRAEELKSQGKDPEDFYSGIACDSFNRFDEDFALAEHLGHNAHRLSIEWARIEPKEGVYSEEALDHYEEVLRSAKAHGLTTFVTPPSFYQPLVVYEKGRFCQKRKYSPLCGIC